MLTLILLACLVSLSQSGIISHDIGGDDGHGKATSYQDIHMEHFHAVPTYVKKEYKHLLEHPIPVGKSASKLEVHHGGKHDHGYAISDTHNNARGSALGGHGDDGFDGYGGGSLSGHEGADLGGHDADLGHGVAGGGYEVHDQNDELSQQHAHSSLQLQAAAALAHAGAGLGHGGAGGNGLGLGGGSLGHYQAAAVKDHEYGAAAVQFQNVAHDHSS